MSKLGKLLDESVQKAFIQYDRVTVVNPSLWSVGEKGTVTKTNGVGPCPTRVRFEDGSTDLFANHELREPV